MAADSGRGDEASPREAYVKDRICGQIRYDRAGSVARSHLCAGEGD